MISYDPIIQNINALDGHQVDVLRLDLLHKEIPGNKWFKLKHNLEKAKREGHHTLLTFGGAYSNHIAACAAACKLAGLSSIGVIRGEATDPLNHTLKIARENGMKLHFISRELYKEKNEIDFIVQLQKEFGPFYLIPEGGSNKEGVLGCMEILKPEWNYDYIFCASGTGCTYTGLALSAPVNSTVVGINVLKGQNVISEWVNAMINELDPENTMKVMGNEELDNFRISRNCITDRYAFKGYARYEPILVEFKDHFEQDFKIPLDHIYTGKLFFAVFDLIKSRKLRAASKILVVHSGGQQANISFEKRYHLETKQS